MLVMLLTSCVTLDNLFNLPVFSSLIYKLGIIAMLIS